MHTKVIAEIGSNHNGSFETAKRLIKAASLCGADAVKFQVFRAEWLAHPKHPSYDIIKANELPREWLPELIAFTHSLDLEFGATPCDLEAVELLKGADWLKIASGDITYEPLIRAAGETGKHILLSTGASFRHEIIRAVSWIESTSNVTILQCTMAYPCESQDAHLRWMWGWMFAWNGFPPKIGFSDHTLSIVLPAVAVGMGATVIEKHFTLSRNQVGTDHGHSLEPEEFAQMVKNIREAELALGDGEKRVLDCEKEILPWARRGCYDGKWLRPSDKSLVEG